MNRGYIKIWRKLEDSGILGNAEVCQLFMFLMVKAAHKSRKIMAGTQIIELQPGQYFAGRKKLAVELNSTEQKIRTALSTLQKHEIINQQSTSLGTIISLINWGKYQTDQPAPNQQSNQQLTSDQPAPNQRLTTKQDIKNLEFKNINTSSNLTLAEKQSCAREAVEQESVSAFLDSQVEFPGRVPETDPGLEFLELREFYNQHGRGEGQQAGFAEYKQLRAGKAWPGQDVIYRAISALSAQDAEWKGGYAPGLAKFLREKQWGKTPRAAPVNKASVGKDQSPLSKNMQTAATVLAAREARRRQESEQSAAR